MMVLVNSVLTLVQNRVLLNLMQLMSGSWGLRKLKDHGEWRLTKRWYRVIVAYGQQHVHDSHPPAAHHRPLVAVMVVFVLQS